MSLSPRYGMPAQDDAIVRRVADPSGRYILGTRQAPRQFLCASYGAAIATARTYARTSHVHVWLTEDDRTFAAVTTRDMTPAANTRRRRTGS
jgi:hypothetical protein